MKVFWLAVCASAALWAVGMAFDGHGVRIAEAQKSVWVAKGAVRFSDYWCPWLCANDGYQQAVEADFQRPGGGVHRMSEMDRCYPAFAMIPHRVLPYSEEAAVGYTLAGAIVFLLALVTLSNKKWWVVMMALTAPFIFSFDRANPIWFSAAGVAVFLAWWDDENPWKRTAASACLAIAAAIKLVPIVLLVLYAREFVKRRNRTIEQSGQPVCRSLGEGGANNFSIFRQVFIAASLFLILLLVPFFWFSGLDGFAQWLHNAVANGRVMAAHTAFGFYTFVRAIKVVLGMDWHEGVTGWRIATQAFGGVLLLASIFARSRYSAILLAVTGMLFAAGNMMFYGALYLIPVFLLCLGVAEGEDGFCSSNASKENRTTNHEPRITLFLWFSIFCPFQIPFFHITLNHFLAAFAVFALSGIELWYHSGVRHTCENNTP